jgi:hypothetical protein
VLRPAVLRLEVPRPQALAVPQLAVAEARARAGQSLAVQRAAWVRVPIAQPPERHRLPQPVLAWKLARTPKPRARSK